MIYLALNSTLDNRLPYYENCDIDMNLNRVDREVHPELLSFSNQSISGMIDDSYKKYLLRLDLFAITAKKQSK